MKKFLKITAIVLFLLIATVILLPIIFKGKIIEMAKAEANNNLNAKFEFADLNLSLIKKFPNISAEFKELSITGIDTFANDTLIYIKKFKATLDLMSVISGDEIKIKQITLDEPKIYVKILQNGKANYDIEKIDTTAVVAEVDSTEESNFKLNIDKFEIKDGNLIYDDLESETFAAFETLNFVLSGDMTEAITNLKIKMSSDSLTVSSEGVKYLNKVKFKFDSDLKADLEKSIYTFKENVLKLNEINLDFSGFVEMPAEDIIMDLTFKSKDSKFKDALSMVPAIYQSDFEGVETDGLFNFDGYAKGIYNDSLMPAYGINLLIKNAYFKYPDLPKSVKNINVDMKVDAEAGTGDNMTINIKKASMTMAENPISMNVFVKMTAADVALNGKINGKINLTSLKDVIPLEDTGLSGNITADLSFKGNLSDIENENYEKFDASGNLMAENMHITMPDMPAIDIFKTDMSFSPQFVDLKQFDAKVGKSDLHLNGKLLNIFSYVFKDELLTGVFNFNSNFLDIDELMLSTASDETSSGTDTETGAGEEQKSGESEIIEIPGNLDFTLNSNIGKIVYDKLTITNAVGIIIIKDSKLDMRQLKMNMLGGSLSITGLYDSKDKSKPFADLKMNISEFNIAQVADAFLSVKKLVPIIENSVGNFSANISLNSILDQEMMPVLASLISSGNINSNNISIKNNRLFEMVSSTTKQDKFKSPQVNNLDLNYFIDNGKLTVKPTKFKIAGSEVSFGGTQGLDKALDFDLGMVLPKSIAGSLISKFPIGSSTENVDVKAKIGGTSDQPKIVGFSSGLTDAIKDEITEKVEDVKEKVKDQANKIIDEARKKADLVIREAEVQAGNIKSEADKQGKRLVSEAENQGNRLINEAKNPIAKKAAEITKDKLVKEAREKALNLNKTADKQAGNIINAANTKSDNIMLEAKNKAGI